MSCLTQIKGFPILLAKKIQEEPPYKNRLRLHHLSGGSATLSNTGLEPQLAPGPRKVSIRVAEPPFFGRLQQNSEPYKTLTK